MTINSRLRRRRSRIFSHRIAAGAARWSVWSWTRFWKSRTCSNCEVCSGGTWACQGCRVSTGSIEASHLTILKNFRLVNNSWSKMIIRIILWLWWALLVAGPTNRTHKIDYRTRIRKRYWISWTQGLQSAWRTWPQMQLKCQPERSKQAQIRLQLGKDHSL